MSGLETEFSYIWNECGLFEWKISGSICYVHQSKFVVIYISIVIASAFFISSIFINLSNEMLGKFSSGNTILIFILTG